MVALYFVYILVSAANAPFHVANYSTMADCEAAAANTKLIGNGQTREASAASNIAFFCVPIPRGR